MLRRAGRRGALARRRAWLCRRAERENLKRRRLPTPSRCLAVSLGGRFDPGHHHRPAEVAALAMLTIPCSARQPLFGDLGRPPIRDRSLSGLHFRVVRAAGLEPAQAFRPYGFSYPLRLSPPPFGVWGLDYPFTLARARLRCCPSSLYTFRRHVGAGGLARDCHLERFPRLWAVLQPRFPGVHSIAQVRCVYQFRHARTWLQI
jgi:hypothetical protein